MARIIASQQEKKKKIVEPRRVNHSINVSSTMMYDVDVRRRMVFGFEERREQMRKREIRERREEK